MAIGRKIFCELPRHGFDPLDHAALEIPRLEIRFHLAADVLPAFRANLGVNAAVGDDLDVAVRQQQIDQHAAVVRGVPDPQMREQIQRALARRLVPKQRRAVERAFHDKADLARVRGFARLDRLLYSREHVRRKHLPDPPVVFEKVLADALDVHVGELRYQLPDAPPPPKLPPPPLNPLSLSLEPPPPPQPPP